MKYEYRIEKVCLKENQTNWFLKKKWGHDK